MQSQAASQPCPVLLTDTGLRPSQRDPEIKSGISLKRLEVLAPSNLWTSCANHATLIGTTN